MRPALVIALLVVGCVVFGISTGAASGLLLAPQSLTALTAPATAPLSTCTLTAVADAYVDRDVLAADSNFGTAPTLSVRSSALGNRRSFVRFDLTGCPDLTTTRITSATVHLFATTAAASRTYDLHLVTASWSEAAVTGNNQPTVAGAATASAATAAGEMSWSVGDDVSDFVDGSANHGWRVADRTEGEATAVTSTFASREDGTAARRPRLEIKYYP